MNRLTSCIQGERSEFCTSSFPFEFRKLHRWKALLVVHSENECLYIYIINWACMPQKTDFRNHSNDGRTWSFSDRAWISSILNRKAHELFLWSTGRKSCVSQQYAWNWPVQPWKKQLIGRSLYGVQPWQKRYWGGCTGAVYIALPLSLSLFIYCSKGAKLAAKCPKEILAQVYIRSLRIVQNYLGISFGPDLNSLILKFGLERVRGRVLKLYQT